MDNKILLQGAGEKDSLIVCRNSQGMEVRATPLRMTQHLGVFEVYNPYSILHLSEFLKEQQKVNIVRPDFKVVVADMQTMLNDLRRWMEQVELGVRSQPSANRNELERDIIRELQNPILPSLIPLFERFEETCGSIEEDLRPAHGTYVKRQIHP